MPLSSYFSRDHRSDHITSKPPFSSLGPWITNNNNCTGLPKHRHTHKQTQTLVRITMRFSMRLSTSYNVTPPRQRINHVAHNSNNNTHTHNKKSVSSCWANIYSMYTRYFYRTQKPFQTSLAVIIHTWTLDNTHMHISILSMVPHPTHWRVCIMCHVCRNSKSSSRQPPLGPHIHMKTHWHAKRVLSTQSRRH